MDIKLFTLSLSLAKANEYGIDAVIMADSDCHIPKFIDRPKFIDKEIRSITSPL